MLSTRTLSERAGTTVALKAENLQRTGSFKLRGALAKLASLDSEACTRGVVCGSAGNHAQAVAYSARARQVPCEVFMPVSAPIAKVEAATALGASVRLTGETVDECLRAAHERAASGGMAFIHPFDDAEVIAGQGSVGLELLEQVPDLARVVVPVGGGGLLSGIAVAVKAARPEVTLVGVQVEACAPFQASLAAGEVVPYEAQQATIADGIAVKRPGELTLRHIEALVDEMVVVDEDGTAEAMVLLLERAKLVVEGAGAVGVAALLAGRLEPVAGTTAIVLSGGNVDAGLLAEVARHNETQARRRLIVRTSVPDRPGALVALLSLIASSGANVVDVQHLREGLDLHVRETAVQLVIGTRGPEHAAAVVESLRSAGYAHPDPVS